MTADNKIDGAVLVLVDIDDLKRSEREAKAARDYAEATIRTARDPMIVLRADLRVNTANEAFYKAFKTTPDQAEGRLIYDLGDQQSRRFCRCQKRSGSRDRIRYLSAASEKQA